MYPEKEWLAHLAERRFMLQRSRASGAIVYPPRLMVPGTMDQDLEWIEASGEGVVYSTSVVRNKPPVEDYNVALIDLAEGPRAMGRVIGMAPEAVRIGMRVRAEVGEIDGKAAVLWRLGEGAAP